MPFRSPLNAATAKHGVYCQQCNKRCPKDVQIKTALSQKIEKKRSFFVFVGIQLGFIALQDRMPSVMLAQE